MKYDLNCPVRRQLFRWQATLTKDDEVFYDGKTWTVTSEPYSAGYVWISDTAYNGSFNILRKVTDLRPVNEVPGTILNKNCAWHDWTHYVGAVERYDFCKRCDLKRPIDWKELDYGKKST